MRNQSLDPLLKKFEFVDQSIFTINYRRRKMLATYPTALHLYQKPKPFYFKSESGILTEVIAKNERFAEEIYKMSITGGLSYPSFLLLKYSYCSANRCLYNHNILNYYSHDFLDICEILTNRYPNCSILNRVYDMYWEKPRIEISTSDTTIRWEKAKIQMKLTDIRKRKMNEYFTYAMRFMINNTFNDDVICYDLFQYNIKKLSKEALDKLSGSLKPISKEELQASLQENRPKRRWFRFSKKSKKEYDWIILG